MVRRLAGALLVAAGLLVACGDEEPEASSATTPSDTEASSATTPSDTEASSTTTPSDTEAMPTSSVPSTEDAGTAGFVTFESKHYPIALRLPEGVEEGSWADARRPWDGLQGIDMAGPFLDVVFLPSRSLFLFGAATSDDLEAFLSHFAEISARRHSCTEPQNRRDVVIDEVPAVGFSQSCEEGTVQARVALIHDGFGLIVFSITRAGEENAALDEVISTLDGLEWRAR
jgi:hypothetical protein